MAVSIWLACCNTWRKKRAAVEATAQSRAWIPLTHKLYRVSESVIYKNGQEKEEMAYLLNRFFPARTFDKNGGHPGADTIDKPYG